MIKSPFVSTRVLNSSFKHVLGRIDEDLSNYKVSKIFVLKNEVFAFQLLINTRERMFSTLGEYNDIHWKGLGYRLRLSLEILDERGNDISGKIQWSMSYVGYVTDDDGLMKADPILRKKSHYLDKGEQIIWIECKVPQDYNSGNFNIRINKYFTCEYQAEDFLGSESLSVELWDYQLKGPRESGFFMDLWQHPGSWARAYDVEMYSDEHFTIIENYIKDMAYYGQRVTTLILSDYPWGGQRCHEFEDNATNLFEFNIVKIRRGRDGKIYCDFKAMDRYLQICEKYGIAEEIDLMGIVGNWDGRIFGTPVEDYKDPFRLVIFDEKENKFDFIRTKDEVFEYLSMVFSHLKGLGVWHKLKIMSDEPNDIELFQNAMNIIEEAAEGSKLPVKCAIHDQEFFEKYGDNINSLSLNTCEVVKNIEFLDEIKEKIKSKNGKLTWFSCCFPPKLNIFIMSPLIESRLIGWFTYYWNFDGFLRWAYANWTTNPFEDVRYKYPRWRAGDMFLVYPGKDLKPVSSIRIKNILFGLQDYEIFKCIENSGVTRESLEKNIEELVGDDKNMVYDGFRNVSMSYSLDLNNYYEVRNKLIKSHLKVE